ncbi:MAG: hypothetical protein ACXV0U_10515, partial [Kineosporiaceae bacterium]
RGDPAGFAERDLAERRELGLPPAAAVVSLTGPPDAVDGQLAAAQLPPGAVVLGPVPIPTARRTRQGDPGATDVRMLVRAPLAVRPELLAAVRAAVAVRSARRDAAVRVTVDPRDLG